MPTKFSIHKNSVQRFDCRSHNATLFLPTPQAGFRPCPARPWPIATASRDDTKPVKRIDSRGDAAMTHAAAGSGSLRALGVRTNHNHANRRTRQLDIKGPVDLQGEQGHAQELGAKHPGFPCERCVPITEGHAGCRGPQRPFRCASSVLTGLTLVYG